MIESLCPCVPPVDQVFDQILYSTSQEADMIQARQILRNILCRRLYKCVGLARIPESIRVTEVRVSQGTSGGIKS